MAFNSQDGKKIKAALGDENKQNQDEAKRPSPKLDLNVGHGVIAKNIERKQNFTMAMKPSVKQKLRELSVKGGFRSMSACLEYLINTAYKQSK